MKKTIERKLILDDVPIKIYKNGNTGVDFKSHINKPINFVYDGIEGVLYVEKIEGINLYVKYLNNNPYKINKYSFLRCNIGYIINYKVKDFRLNIGDSIIDERRNLTIVDRFFKNNFKKYKYKCNICGWEYGEISESNLLGQKYRCSCSWH